MNGRELRQVRLDRGLSQRALGELWGVSPRMIQKLEAADRAEISAGYQGSADALSRGARTQLPRRRKAEGGKLAKVRTPQGSARPKAARGRAGVTFASDGGQRRLMFLRDEDSRGRERELSLLRGELDAIKAAGGTAHVAFSKEPTGRESTYLGETRAGRRGLARILEALDEADDGDRYEVHGAPGLFIIVTATY